MDSLRYRRLLIGSLAALTAIIVAVIALNPSGELATLPEPLEGVFPPPGDTVVRQTAIEVDLPVGYSLRMAVDGILIPQAEIGFTQATGRYIWQPGPTTLFEVWEGGEHTITIDWDRVAGGGPDPGEFTWSFRVT